MFLSRWNEKSGECENIVSVSNRLEYFKVFKSDLFNCLVVRVKCESEWNAITVCINLFHCPLTAVMFSKTSLSG